MSTQALECQTCKVKGEYERFAAPEDRAIQHLYAVGWKCPQCQNRLVEVCPLGPLAPKATLCINCGAELPDAHVECKGCTLTREKALDFLGVRAPVPNVLDEAAKDFNAGFFRRGLARLNLALEQDYKLHPAWMLKRQFMQALGFNQAIVRMLELALSNGAAPELLVDLGIAQHQLGNNGLAVECYQRYLAVAPTGPLVGPAYGNMGNALSQMGRMQEAEASYKKALELERHRAVNYLNYAVFLRESRRLGEALAVLDGCIALADEDSQFRPERDPFLKHIHTDRSFLLSQLATGARTQNDALDMLRKSVEAADLALADDDKDIKARYFRSKALAMLGRLPEAHADLEIIVKAEPKFEDAQHALSKVKEALAALQPASTPNNTEAPGDQSGRN
jgi:tetratricopeptide (TPR) repeat protein